MTKKEKGNIVWQKGKGEELNRLSFQRRQLSLQFLVVEMSFRRSIFRLAERNDVQPALKKVIL